MTGVHDEHGAERAYVAALTQRCDEAVASMRTDGPPAGLAKLRDLVSDCARCLGPAHRQTIRMRANLASWTGEHGAPEAAAAQLMEVWKLSQGTCGDRDADTLLIACNAAAFAGISGDPQRAVEVLEQVIGKVEAVFGADSATACTARGNLQVWRHRAGGSARKGQR